MPLIIPAKSALRRSAWLGVLLAGLVLGGCVTVPAEEGATARAPVPATHDAHASDAPLSRDTLYLLLEAELAGRRGDPAHALRNYLEVASRHSEPKAAQRAVEIAMSSGDAAGGLEAAALWSRLDPGNRQADEARALLLVRDGATDEAVEVLRGIAAARGGPPGEELRRVMGLLLRDLKGTRESARAASALRIMERLAAQWPEDARAHFVFGEFLARIGAFERAERTFERVLEIEPDDEEATVLLAKIYQQRQDLPRAFETLERALASSSESRALRVTYAGLLVDARRFEEARVQFERLLAADEENEDLRHALGVVLYQTGAFDRAEEEFSRLTGSIDRRDGAWYFLGRIAEARGDVEGALAAYPRVLRGDNWLNARVRTAVLLSGKGRVDEARAHLHGLRGRTADEAMGLYTTEAEILLEHARYEEAVEVYDAALEVWPGHPNLLYSRAMLAVELDDLVAAERDLGAILERNPDHSAALNALGYTLADRTDRIEEAYRLIKRAYELDPDSNYIVDSMGWVMFRMGRYEEALRFLRYAMRLGKDPEIAAHLGEVLWTVGEREAAREVWESALETAPDDEHLLDVKRRFGL